MFFFLLFNTAFNFKINFKQKIDPKMCMFKNLEEIKKNLEKLGKNKWQPLLIKFIVKYLFIYNNLKIND